MSDTVDWLSGPGSQLLAQRVEEFWRDRGVAVTCRTERGWTWRERDYYSLRSNLQLQLPNAPE